MTRELFFINLPFSAGGYEFVAEFYSLAGKHLIVLRDSKRNPIGITNAIEYAATEAFNALAARKSPARHEDVSFVQIALDGQCAKVSFSYHGDVFKNPVWVAISPAVLDIMIGQYQLVAGEV